MKDQWRDAVHCRNRASVLRTIAGEVDSDDHRKSLLRIAQHLETLANKLEQKARDPEQS